MHLANGDAADVTASSASVATLEGVSVVRERRTTQELVHQFLRDAILSGQLRGGARLVQDKLATELNVSRVPVREALLQLEAEGLVRMEAHRGASVVWLSPEEIAELFDIRCLLVTDAVRRAVPQLTDEQIARLEDIEQRQVNESNMAARTRLTHAFYSTLLEHLNRPRQTAMIDRLERELERYLEPLGRPHLGHTALVDACRRRDADRASALVGEHLRRVSERAVKSVRRLMSSGETLRPERRSRRA
jgi:DNA-binding GntR family transcriptional regulator